MEDFINNFSEWVKEQPNILAACYVGSYARGEAKENSDLDLVIITNDPEELLENSTWVERFGAVNKLQREDWGLIQTWRVWYKNGLEIEFNVTDKSWLNDQETKKITSKGIKIVFDPYNLLLNL